MAGEKLDLHSNSIGIKEDIFLSWFLYPMYDLSGNGVAKLYQEEWSNCGFGDSNDNFLFRTPMSLSRKEDVNCGTMLDIVV